MSIFERIPFIRSKSTLIELGLGALLFVLALAIRLPNLLQIPSYTDEGTEVLWGLDIAQGKHFPLTAVDPYDGPFFPYLMAILFRLFGTSVALPRLTIAIFGALTVVATFVLARVMQNRAAGIVSGGFAMTCPLLVIFGSHYGWSSALTPFFATVTAIALYVGVTRHKTGWLGLCGLGAALTLQAHPTSAVALLGMLIWFLSQTDLGQRLRQPAPYLALFLFILGYAPMIVSNLRPDSALVETAYQRSYAFIPTLDPAEYLRRLVVLLRIGGYFVGGGFDEATLILRAQAIAAEILLIAAFAWAWWQHQRLIPIIVLVSILLLPFFIVGDSYRYYFYLFPLIYVVLGSFIVATWRAFVSKSTQSRLAPAALVIGVTTVSVFILYPLYTISKFYDETYARGATNAGYFELARIAHAQQMCGSRMYVESWAPNRVEQKDIPTLFALNNVHYVLTLDGCEHMMASRSAFAQKLSAGGDGWLVVPAEGTSFFDSFNLQVAKTISTPYFNSAFVPISLYRVEPKK